MPRTNVPAMRSLLSLCLAAACMTAGVSAVPATAHAEVPKIDKIAIVDIQRCLMETSEGKRAKKDLEKTFAKGQARLEGKAKKLEQGMRDLQAKAPMLSQNELMKRQEELMRAQAELQQLSVQLQEEVAQKEALLTEKIYTKVAKIVKQIALEEKVPVVLVRSEMTVMYANPRLDLTNRVIVRYDSKNK